MAVKTGGNGVLSERVVREKEDLLLFVLLTFGIIFLNWFMGASLKNRDIILPGMIVGLLGYAVGNFLGIGVGNLIRLLG